MAGNSLLVGTETTERFTKIFDDVLLPKLNLYFFCPALTDEKQLVNDIWDGFSELITTKTDSSLQFNTVPTLPISNEEKLKNSTELMKYLLNVCEKYASHCPRLEFTAKLIQSGLNRGLLTMALLCGNWEATMVLSKTKLWCTFCQLVIDNIALCTKKDCLTIFCHLVDRDFANQKTLLHSTILAAEELINKIITDGHYVPLYMMMAKIVMQRKERNYVLPHWRLQNQIENLFERFRYLRSLLTLKGRFQFIPFFHPKMSKLWNLDVNGDPRPNPNHDFIPKEKFDVDESKQFLYSLLSHHRSDDFIRQLTQLYPGEKNASLQSAMVMRIMKLVNDEHKLNIKQPQSPKPNQPTRISQRPPLHLRKSNDNNNFSHPTPTPLPTLNPEEKQKLRLQQKRRSLDLEWKVVVDQFFSLILSDSLDFNGLLKDLNSLCKDQSGRRKLEPKEKVPGSRNDDVYTTSSSLKDIDNDEHNYCLSSNKIVWLIANVVVSEQIKEAFEKNNKTTEMASLILNGEYTPKRTKIELDSENESLFDILFSFYKERSDLDVASGKFEVDDLSMGCVLKRLRNIYQPCYSIFEHRYPFVSRASLQKAEEMLSSLKSWHENISPHTVLDELNWKKIQVLSFCPATEILTQYMFDRLTEGAGGQLYCQSNFKGSPFAYSIVNLDKLSVYVILRLMYLFLERCVEWENKQSLVLSPGVVETFARMHYIIPNAVNFDGVQKKYNKNFVDDHVVESLKLAVNGKNLTITNIMMELISFRLVRHLWKIPGWPQMKLEIGKVARELKQRQLYTLFENFTYKFLMHYELNYNIYPDYLSYDQSSGRHGFFRRLLVQCGVNTLCCGSSLFDSTSLTQLYTKLAQKFNNTSVAVETEEFTPLISMNFNEDLVGNRLDFLMKEYRPFVYSDSVLRQFPNPLKKYFTKRNRNPDGSSIGWKPRFSAEEVNSEFTKTNPPCFGLLKDQKIQRDVYFEYFRERDGNESNQNFFLCAIWAILEKTNNLQFNYNNIKLVLDSYSLDRIPDLTQTLIDYVIENTFKKSTMPGKTLPTAIEFTAKCLNLLIWRYQIITFPHVLFALSAGDLPPPQAKIASQIGYHLLIESNEFKDRYEKFIQCAVPYNLHKDDGDWSSKLQSYFAVFPEYYSYELLETENAKPPTKDALPSYYDCVVTRILSPLDIFLHRLIDYNQTNFLLKILAKYRKLYFYHPFPVHYVHKTLSQYYTHPSMTPEIKTCLVSLMDLSALPLVFQDFIAQKGNPDTFVEKGKGLSTSSLREVLSIYLKERFVDLTLFLYRHHHHENDDESEMDNDFFVDQRFSEFKTREESLIYEFAIELLSLPLTANEAMEILLSFIISPVSDYKMAQGMNGIHTINTLAHVLIKTPRPFRTEIFVEFSKIVIDYDELAEANDINDEEDDVDYMEDDNLQFNRAQKHLMGQFKFVGLDKNDGFNLSTPNIVLSLTQAILAHAPAIWKLEIPKLFHFFTTCKRKDGRPAVFCFEQLLYVCHLVGPFLDQLDDHFHRHLQTRPVLENTVVSIFTIIKQINDDILKSFGSVTLLTPATDCIVDFLYHIKYKFALSSQTHQIIARIVPTLNDELQKRLKFIVTHAPSSA